MPKIDVLHLLRMHDFSREAAQNRPAGRGTGKYQLPHRERNSWSTSGPQTHREAQRITAPRGEVECRDKS